jgi:pyruvate carboxylase subunit A
MCAKLTIWALTWERTIARAKRALRDMSVQGVKTTIPYHLEILKTSEFRAAKFDTGFVEQHPELINYSVRRPPAHLAAAIAAAIAAHHGL